MSNLNLKVAKLFIFSLVDLVVNKLGRYIGILILINVVSRETIGVLGIATGYLAFIGYLAIAPEQILLRDYPKGKHGNLNQEISAFGNFWAIRSVLTLLAGIVIFLVLRDENLVLAVVFIGLLIQRLLEGFTNLIQLVFYVDFKQDTVAKINFFNNSFLLVTFLLIFLYQSIYAYVAILTLGEFIFCVIWSIQLRKQFNFVYLFSSGWLSLVKKNLLEFTLWYHLSNATMNVVQNIGPVILSFFASLAVVGEYTIALKIAGFFLIVSQIMQKASFLHFANEMILPEKSTIKTLFAHIKIYGFLSLLAIIAFAFFGKLLIFSFLTKQNVDLLYQLVLIMLIGIFIFNVTRPLLAFASAKYSLRKGFIFVYIPSLVSSLVSYFLGTAYLGPFGLALAMIINYFTLFLLSLGFVSYATRKIPKN